MFERLRRRARTIATLSGGLGTPSFVAKVWAGTNGGTSLAPAVPSGTLDGDIMVAFVSISNTTTVLTDATGWTFLEETLPGATQRIRSYWRRAASEPASYTWSISPSAAFGVAVSSIRDCLASGTPIDGSVTENTGATATATATGITTANNNTMLVMGAHALGTRSYSASTLTECHDTVGEALTGPSTFVAAGIQASAGASGNKDATLSSSSSWGAQLVAIKPRGGV